MTATRCPSCPTAVFAARSMSGIPILLEAVPSRWKHAVYTVDERGVAIETHNPPMGAKRYRAHDCRPASEAAA